MGSASATASTGSLAVSWSADATYVSGVTYTFHHVAISIAGQVQTSTQQSGTTSLPASGSTLWGVTAYYGTTGSAAAVGLGSGAVTVPAPPGMPPTPAAPAGLTATDNTSSVQLDASAVTHPSGTTLTYEVQRNGSTIATGLTVPSYTDTAPGSARPITYGMRAASVGDGTAYSGTAYSAYATVQTNGTPFAPTRTSPADAATLDLTVTQRLRWTPGFPTSSDAQSKFDVGLSSDGGTTWTTTTIATPNSYYDIPAGTLTAGAWQWRVRVYGASGVVGPYSTAGHFTAASPPTDVTITYPTSNGYVQQADHLDWSTPDQSAYQVQRVADNAGSPDTSTVYYDSGEVGVGGARTASLTFDVNSRFEHVRLRIKDAAGLWSDWVDVLVFVAFTPPPAAMVYGQPVATDDVALIRYFVTTPQPVSGEPPATAVTIAARRVGSTVTEWQRGATNLLPPTGPVDFANPASGVEYEVQVTTIAESGATTSTDWMR